MSILKKTMPIINVKMRSVFFNFFPLLFFCPSFAQNISKRVNPEGWEIKTRNSCYQLLLTKEKKVIPVFYGAESESGNQNKEKGWFNNIEKPGNWIRNIEDVPVRGDFPFKQPLVEAVFPNGVRDLDLIYTSDQINNESGISILKIVYRDRYYPLEIISYYKVYDDVDIIEKWMTVKNTSNDRNYDIMLENVLSGSVVLPHNNYNLVQLSGVEMNEFQIEETPLSSGLKTIGSSAFKSNFHAPWFMVKTAETTKEDGETWLGAVHYSGNWTLKFDKRFNNTLQIVGGINFWDTHWVLKSGESFTSPKISVGYSRNGTSQANVNYHNYVRKYVLPVKHKNELRPVLYNGWENSYYDINEKQQISLANAAKEIGVELFVVDDGWFKNRTASNSGLGNYLIDKKKFPNGLKPLIDHVHGLGMKFGLWIEPESVSDNADIFVANPDWTFQFDAREKGRYRKLLNLANEKVYNYLLNSLSKLLSDNSIDFIKWYQNSYLSEPGWANAPNNAEREARIRHISNVYRLIDELRKKFPDVFFETCASGGGRVDLGMLSKMDEAWVSDNTDPLDRLFIQQGYSMMLPANTMVSWVTSMTRSQPVSLNYRFDVSMAGVLGVGANIAKWDDADKEIARNKIALYKKIRPVVQQGDYYSLVSPFEADKACLQYSSHDKNTSVVFFYNLSSYLNGSRRFNKNADRVLLKGLDPQHTYSVRRTSNNSVMGTYKGSYLMEVGIGWPVEKKSLVSEIVLVE